MSDPINWGVVASVVVPVVVAALGTWAAIASKRTQKGTRENAIIDQMQEMIKAERDDRKEAEGIMRGDIAQLKTDLELERQARRDDRSAYNASIRVRDGYISHLRHHIDSGKPPPAPEWPPGFND